MERRHTVVKVILKKNSDQANLIPVNQLFLLPAMERMWLIKIMRVLGLNKRRSKG